MLDIPSSISFYSLVSIFTGVIEIAVPFCVNVQYDIIPPNMGETPIHLTMDVLSL